MFSRINTKCLVKFLELNILTYTPHPQLSLFAPSFLFNVWHSSMLYIVNYYTIFIS